MIFRKLNTEKRDRYLELFSLDNKEIFPNEVRSSNVSHESWHDYFSVGKAYLWHQIRCIMAVLFLIGEGKEEPEVITQLLGTFLLIIFFKPFIYFFQKRFKFERYNYN